MPEIVTENKCLFISVKPEFAEKFIKKQKTIELRKTKPNVSIGDFIIIYASSPKKLVVGFGIIKKIIITTPEIMWKKFSSKLGIDKIRFDSYYRGYQSAIGIEVDKVNEIQPVHLEDLRNIEPQFHPPQVYRYISNMDNYTKIIKLIKLPQMFKINYND
jgi:predicted transcriptional regulator